MTTTNKSVVQITAILEKLFEEHFEKKAEIVEALAVSGSDRRYYRLSAGKISAIGTYNTNVAENNTYFYFTELFRRHEINVPEVYKMSRDRRAYLQRTWVKPHFLILYRKRVIPNQCGNCIIKHLRSWLRCSG